MQGFRIRWVESQRAFCQGGTVSFCFPLQTISPLNLPVCAIHTEQVQEAVCWLNLPVCAMHTEHVLLLEICGPASSLTLQEARRSSRPPLAYDVASFSASVCNMQGGTN